MVVKPIVESVLSGYNGTIMAYGQTGTGKTFKLGSFIEKGIVWDSVYLVQSAQCGINTSSPTGFFPYCQHAFLSYHTVFAPLVSLIGHRAVLAICFFVRKHYIREEHPQSSRVHEFHGMNRRLIKAIPSLIFTAVLEDNSTSRTCAICLEDYTVGEKNHMKESIEESEQFDCESIISHMQHYL